MLGLCYFGYMSRYVRSRQFLFLLCWVVRALLVSSVVRLACCSLYVCSVVMLLDAVGVRVLLSCRVVYVCFRC